MNTYATAHTDLKGNDNHIKQQVRLEHETKKINIILKNTFRTSNQKSKFFFFLELQMQHSS